MFLRNATIKFPSSATPITKPRIDFWDIGTPILWGMFFTSIFLTFLGLKKRSSSYLILASALTGFVSFFALWSVGSYIIIIALLQLIGAIAILLRTTLTR